MTSKKPFDPDATVNEAPAGAPKRFDADATVTAPPAKPFEAETT